MELSLSAIIFSDLITLKQILFQSLNSNTAIQQANTFPFKFLFL